MVRWRMNERKVRLGIDLKSKFEGDWAKIGAIDRRLKEIERKWASRRGF